jgi:hypothetical protein
MDCEKFEETMLAELYDELDELTSAAAKRHVAGCARCAALIGGLRATRRVATVPLVEPPPDLELRILAATKNLHNVVPFKRRVGRAISWAGSWAMRPQTAMAAVFLVMVGSSLVFLRASRSKQELAAAPVTVMERGTPAPAASMATGDKGGVDLPRTASLPPAVAEPVPMMGNAVASAAPTDLYATKSRAANELAKDPSALALTEKAEAELDRAIANAGPVAGVPVLPQAAAPRAATRPASPPMHAAQDADGTLSPYRDQGPGQAGGQAQTVSPTFTRARAAAQAGRFDEATQLFDTLAPNDVNAQLQAAKAMQSGHGCSMAVSQRYDAVAARAGQMPIGWDATLSAGVCYAQINRNDLAAQRFNSLLQVPSYAARAQAQLQALSQVAARKSAAPPPPPAATATAPAQASPPPAGAATGAADSLKAH